MKLFKKKTIFTCMFLTLILCLSFLLPGFVNSKNNIATRNINVNEIGTLSYEEKVEKLQNQFSNIETKTENNLSYFSGDINLSNLDFLSTEYENSNVKNNYQSTIDNSSETINITSNVIVDGDVIQTQDLNFSTEYNENTEQLFIVDESGKKIDIMEELKEEKIEECFFLTAIFAAITIKQIVAIVVVSAVAILVVANTDQIANDISALTSGIRDGFISFWDRIKLACGKITAVVLSGTIALTQSIAIEIYETAKNRKDCYLLCGTITGNGFIPVKYKFTNYENARNWIKKGGSVWSPFSSTATNCITGAGYIPMVVKKGITYTFSAERHAINITVDNVVYSFGYYHYHAGNKKSLSKVNAVHSFFGLPFEGEPV